MTKAFLFAGLLTLASAAQAVSFVAVPGAPDPGFAPLTAVVTFDAPNAPGYVWSAGTIADAVGTSSAAAAPSGNLTRYGYVSSDLTPNFAELTTPGVRVFSFYWGSIDLYNSVELYGAGDVLLHTVAGGDFSPANGDQIVPGTNMRVTFTADPGAPIYKVRFISTGVAFEFDDIATGAVPEPATWALLIAGFGLVGAAARRRRAQLLAVA
jgi:hypothetical protein